MKRFFMCSIVFFSFVLMLSAATSEAGEDMFSYIPYGSASWDSKTTTETGADTTVVDQKVMFKGKKMRMDGVLNDKSSGKKVNQIMIMTNKEMYIINADEKSGTKFSMNSAANPEKYREQAAKYRKTAKKTGSETIGGIACDIYKYTYVFDGQENGDKMNMTEWRSKDGFVVKSASEWKDTKTVSLLSNLKKNPVLEDSLFVPAADIKIMDMDNMMKGIFSAPAEEDNSAVKSSKPKPAATEVNVEKAVGDEAEKEVKDEAVDAAKNVMKGLFGQ